MSVDESDRDVPDCWWPATPGEVEYRPLPGWPRYRVGSDRSVWRRGPLRPPPWDEPRWRRLAPFTKGGYGPYVTLRHEGREHVRTVNLLHRAAFAAASRHDAWIRRIGPAAHLRFRPPTAPGPVPPDAAVAPAAPPGPEPATLGSAPAALPGPGEQRDPHAAYRPVPGFPGYEIGSDYSVWLEISPATDGSGWRRVPLHPRAGRDPKVMLFRDGKPRLVTVAGLAEKAFAVSAVLPEGRPRAVSVSRGSQHGRALLDETEVIEARRLKRREGLTAAELARRYGVSDSAMRAALSGLTWGHIPMDGT